MKAKKEKFKDANLPQALASMGAIQRKLYLLNTELNGDELAPWTKKRFISFWKAEMAAFTPADQKLVALVETTKLTFGEIAELQTKYANKDVVRRAYIKATIRQASARHAEQVLREYRDY